MWSLGFFAVFGAVLLIGGWGAYAGWNRRWLTRPGTYQGHLGPSLVLIGGGGVLMGLSPLSLLAAQDGPTTASAVVFGLLFGGGLLVLAVGHFMATSGMPARWRPGWVRELEGLPRRPGGPSPDPIAQAPAWSTLARGGPHTDESCSPPLPLLPEQTVQAVFRSVWGGARSAQKDPQQLAELQRTGLLDERLHPTSSAALILAGRLREDVEVWELRPETQSRRWAEVTVVDGQVAVLELCETHRDNLGIPFDHGTWDVLPYRSDEQIEALVEPWLTAPQTLNSPRGTV